MGDSLATSSSPLRVVLFGMPAAGKSSLLGALAQAATSQTRALEGRVVDMPAGLQELQRRVYENDPRSTEEEIIAYPVTMEPFVESATQGERWRVDLVDCDGRTASSLLARRIGISEASAESELIRSALDADALLLVADVAAAPEQADADRSEFLRFLRLLRQHRGANADVAGLPVWLVLTKCDLLAQPDESSLQWQERIEQRLRRAEERFRSRLAKEDDADRFGSLDLHTAATAVRRPELANMPAQPREPFGVAELFRHSIAAARNYQRRETASRRRLGWTLAGTGTMLAVLLTAALAFVSSREMTRRLPLMGKVDNYQSREGTTAVTRLRGPLEVRLGELAEISADPDFEKLPLSARSYVSSREAELQAYLAWQRQLAAERPPAEIRSADDLDALVKRLRGPLAVPKDYADTWARTELALLREQWLADAETLRAAVDRITAWYGERKREGDQLLLFSDPTGPAASKAWSDWQSDVSRLMQRASESPFDPDRLLEVKRSWAASPPVRFADALDFPAPRRAADDWQRTRDRLRQLRQIVAALGLTGETDAPLQIQAKFRARESARRMEQLRRDSAEVAEWSLRELPEGVMPAIRAAAERSRGHLMTAGQEEVLTLLREVCPGGRDTPECWQLVAERLPTTPALAGVADLARLLARLSDQPADDPVAVLTAFLRRPAFDLKLDRLTLAMSFDLRDRVRPDGPLTIYHQPAGAEAPRAIYLALQPDDGSSNPMTRVATFEFVADKPARLSYRPGDAFWAELPLRNRDGSRWQMTWSVCRSLTYQYERLARSPRLHKAGQNPTTGDLTDEAHVRVDWTVPDLLPVVPAR